MADLDLDQMLRDREIDVIARTERKYGDLGKALAMNIVDNGEEADKILVKGLQKMWNDDPPPEGANFSVNFLRKIRDCSIDSRKYRNDLPECEQLTELEECVLPPFYEDKYTPVGELSEKISRFLEPLDKELRALFVQRYFLCVSSLKLCQINHYEWSEAQKILSELVSSLKAYLQKSGASCTAMGLFEAIGGIDDSSVILGTAFQAPERKKQDRKTVLLTAAICAVIAVLLILSPKIKSALKGETGDTAYDSTHTSFTTMADLNKQCGTDFIGYDFGDDDSLRITTQDLVATYPEGCAEDPSQWSEVTCEISGSSPYASKYKLSLDIVPGDTAEDQANLDGSMTAYDIDGTPVWVREYVSSQGTSNCYSGEAFFTHDGWTYEVSLVTSIDDRSEGYSNGYLEELIETMMK